MRIVAGILAVLWAGALQAATISSANLKNEYDPSPPPCYTENVQSVAIRKSGFVFGQSYYADSTAIISDPEVRLPEKQFVRANCRRFDAVSVRFDTTFGGLFDTDDGTPFTPMGLTTFFYGLRDGSLVAALAARPGTVTFGKEFRSIDKFLVSVFLPQSIRWYQNRWDDFDDGPIFDGRYPEDLYCLRDFCSVLTIKEITLAPIPVPSSLPLVLAALVPLVGLRARRRSRAA